MFKNLPNILIFGSLYAYSYIFFEQPFELYLAYVIFLLFFPLFIIRFGIPKLPVYVFIPLLISGVVYCLTGDNTFQQFFKIFLGFFLSVLFYHYVVQQNNYDIKYLFKMYMQSAYIISIIGAFQVFSYLIRFTPGYNFRWIFNKWNPSPGGIGVRISSLLSEPAYYAAIIAPAFFVALYNILKRKEHFVSKRKSLLILAIYPLSYSSLGILGILIAILLLMINLGSVRYYLIMIPALYVIGTYSYRNVDEFKDRMDGTLEIYSTENIYSYDIHGSSFVLYNNSHIAWTNFKQHPLFGTGLGSHPIAFDRYSLTNEVGSVQIKFNKMDANSMLLRLLSETGLYGVFFMLYILIKNLVFRWRSADEEYWLMSNGIALIVLIYLLRQGHYFINGFPLFLWMHFYLGKINRNELKSLPAQ